MTNRPAFELNEVLFALDQPLIQECFRFIITNRKKPKIEPVIYDKNRVAYKGFPYLDKNELL